MSRPAKKGTPKPAAKRSATTGAFSDEERAAMNDRARELKSDARATRGRSEGERDLLAKLATMGERDRTMAERLRAIVTACAPELVAKTWYGMPAWARGEKVVCFFQAAEKFKTRYATLGFSDAASLDDGAMWPTAFALKSLSSSEEARIRELVTRAAGG